MSIPGVQLLAGKTAAITGGTTGIGRAIALVYLSHGAKVCVNHLGDQPLTHSGTGAPASASHYATLKEEAAKEGWGDNLCESVGDISRPETGEALVQEVVSRWGRLDVFVSNAGICRFAEFLTLEHELLTATVNTNLIGAFTAVQAAARQMVAQSPQGGSIIGVSSISALVGGGGQTHYTPTKAGILSLMQSCAVALGKYNIRCNALLPGTIRTYLNDHDMEDTEKRKYMESRTALGRLGVPNDLAGPAVFLGCEQLSGYVTGSQMLVDGGLFVNLQ
ncbi:hypothetical protein FH972_025197 [Carpinus fangiana]|uniref:Uncharacterized protein n=1 Tax=Carpinus fangiana TaxID=176857 RepID=A0A5N6L0N2_9ROSI|nr:hypothetical protein FH972_025197 [Carpinus fangiana]